MVGADGHRAVGGERISAVELRMNGGCAHEGGHAPAGGAARAGAAPALPQYATIIERNQAAAHAFNAAPTHGFPHALHE